MINLVPPKKKKSCDFCRKRKIKCNRGYQQPCESCIKYGNSNCLISENDKQFSFYETKNTFIPRINSASNTQDCYSCQQNHSCNQNEDVNFGTDKPFQFENTKDYMIFALQDEVRALQQRLDKVQSQLCEVDDEPAINLRPIFNTHSIYHFFSSNCLHFMENIIIGNNDKHKETTEFSNLKHSFKQFESLVPTIQSQRLEATLKPDKSEVNIACLNKDDFYRSIHDVALDFPDDNWLLCLSNDSSSFSNVLHTLEQYNNNIIFDESIGFYSYWCIRIFEKKYSRNVNEKSLKTWYKYMESKLYNKLIETTAGEQEDLTIKLCHDILMIVIFLITKSNYMFTLQLFKFLNIFQMILKGLGYYEYSRICILNHFEIDTIYRVLILLDYIMVDASFKLGKPLINENFLDSIFENEVGKKFLDSHQDFSGIYMYTAVKKECYLNMFASNVKFENANQLIGLLHRLNNKLDKFDVAMKDVINEKVKLTTFQVLGVDSRIMKILINRLPIQICMASHLKSLLRNDELKVNLNSTLEYARTILHMYCREDNIFTFPLMVSSLHLCVSMIQSISRGVALDMFLNDLIKMDSIFLHVIKNNVLQKEFLQRIIFLMFSIIEYNNMLNPTTINNFTDHLQNLTTFQKYESYNFNLDLESIIDRASSFFNPILEYDSFASILEDPNDKRW